MSSDDEISALLRSSRVDEPMPADVAARLDDVLAGLAPAPPADTEPAVAPVVPLRRRLAPRLLAAAAAVVLVGGVGVGLDQVLRSSSSDQAASSDAGGQALESADEDAAVAPEAGAPTEDRYAGTTPPLELSRQSLTADLREAARTLDSGEVPLTGHDVSGQAPTPVPAPGPTPVPQDVDADALNDVRTAGCPVPALANAAAARSQVVTLDGILALLVLGPAQRDGLHAVELWSCVTDALVVRDRVDLD